MDIVEYDSSITEALADFAVSLDTATLEPRIVSLAKMCVLDSLGCGIFASGMPWTQSVARAVGRNATSGPGTVWGTTQTADALGAAIVNGTSVQGYELDDCHDQSMSHYGASVVPAVIALSEALGNVTGEQLVLAVVAGYELGSRIGNTVSPGAFHRGFHPCGVTGPFAAAAACAKLLELDRDATVNALGLAGSQAAGLMASQYGAMAKRFHSGKAAHSGMMAALAASEGLTGVRNVLEASYGGFCSTYSGESDPALAIDGLGERFEIERNGFKRYSALASSHTTVDALRAIKAESDLDHRDVESVRVETTTMVHRHCGWPYEPRETITAQMNLPYTAAVTLIYGDAFVDQYTDERLRDPEILAVADKVDVVVAPDLDELGKDEMRAVRVTVETTGGDTFEQAVTYRSGHWKNPLSEEDLRAKFRNLSGRTLTPKAVDQIEDTVLGLETITDPIPALTAALQDVDAG